MYVLVHQNRVLAGPMAWNRGIFEGNLQKLGIPQGLGREPPSVLPYQIDENTKIYEAMLVYPEYEKKIEYPHGPFWEFTDIAIGTFQLVAIPIEQSRGYIKSIVTDNRYIHENKGFTTTVNGQEVFIPTSRSERFVFYEKYLGITDDETVNWKFNTGWINLSRSNLLSISQQITNYVQAAFDWEKNKHEEIDNCTDRDIIKNIVLEP